MKLIPFTYWNMKWEVECQCIRTWDGVYLHCKQQRWGYTIALCRAILLEYGVYKYVQGKFTLYKISATVEEKRLPRWGCSEWKNCRIN